MRLLENNKNLIIGVITVVLVSFMLRVYSIGSFEIWLDEAFTHFLSVKSNWTPELLAENNPPLYFVLMRIWIALFGSSPEILRGLSAIFGTMLVISVMWAGYEFWGRKVAIISGIIATISPINIYYSQEARVYALLSALIVLAYVLCWRAVNINTWKTWTSFTIVAALALYSHYLAILGLIPTLLILVLFGDKSAKNKYFFSAFVASIVFIPWILWSFVFTQHQLTGTEWVGEVWLRTPPSLSIGRSMEVLALGSHKGLLPYSLKNFDGITYPVAVRLLGLLAIIVSVATSVWSARTDRKILLVFLMFLTPLLLLWAISFVKPIYVPGRYDIIASGAFSLLLGYGFSRLGAKKYIQYIVFSAFFLAVGVKLIGFYSAIPTAQVFAGTARAIEKQIKPGDVVVFTRLRGLPTIYYLNQLGYEWENGTCRHESSKIQFGCRMFPSDTEKMPATYDPQRVLAYPEKIKSEVDGYINRLSNKDSSIWIVFENVSFSATGGYLEVPAPDDRLLVELQKANFRARLIDDDMAPGVFRFTRE
jgi:mannosyltransferase